MKVLLDTNILIWWLADSPRLKPKIKKLLISSDNQLSFSVSSAWEMSIKKSLKKLETPSDLELQLERNKIDLLPITMESCRMAETLAHHHGDPFDRMLIAQAMENKLRLVTANKVFEKYKVKVILNE